MSQGFCGGGDVLVVMVVMVVVGYCGVVDVVVNTVVRVTIMIVV